MAKNSSTAHCWSRTLRRIVGAAKNIEIQKEYEQHLKGQFAAADEDGNGTLAFREFAGLLQQLNIDLSEGQLARIFDEVNTDRTPAVGGEQVIDEQEFLEFYHGLLDRQELREIFRACTHRCRGLAMTVEELHQFLTLQQRQQVRRLVSQPISPGCI